MAQFGRALRSGRRSRRFESCHLDHKEKHPLAGCFSLCRSDGRTCPAEGGRRLEERRFRLRMAVLNRQGVSSYKVHSTLWTDTCHLDHKNPWKLWVSKGFSFALFRSFSEVLRNLLSFQYFFSMNIQYKYKKLHIKISHSIKLDKVKYLLYNKGDQNTPIIPKRRRLI